MYILIVIIITMTAFIYGCYLESKKILNQIISPMSKTPKQLTFANLTALVNGNQLTSHQKWDARNEFGMLLDELAESQQRIKELEDKFLISHSTDKCRICGGDNCDSDSHK